MLHVFFVFNFFDKKNFYSKQIEVNKSIGDNPFFSQFNLVLDSDFERTRVPIYSFCINSLSILKTKILSHVINEIDRVNEKQKMLAFSMIARYVRIDLTRVIEKKGEVLLEFVQDCDSCKIIYEPVNFYEYQNVGQTERSVFSSLVNKSLMLASGDLI